jgi:carboxyl-terminal processing protease
MPKFDCLSFSARSRKDLLQAGVRMEYGNLGISWVPGEYPYICGVTGGGGAERAGIRAGDTLIAVNGVSAYGLSPESVNNLVTGIRGQAAIVSITRGGTPHNVYAQYTGIQDLSAFEQPRANWWLNYWRGQ